ncbi:hypothetical protein OROHE_002266 [Orobanche hederae]
MEFGKRKRGHDCYTFHSLPWEVPRDLDGYTIHSFKVGRACVETLVRDCGDFNEFTPFKSTIFNELPFEGCVVVSTVGGIPDHKRKGLLIKIPCPPFKIPKKIPPQEAAKFWDKALEENRAQFNLNFAQALEKASHRQACPEEEEEKGEGEAHNSPVKALFYLAPVLEPGCELINKDDNGEKGTGSSFSGDLTKDSNAVNSSI